jgi:hypothetical protein
LYRETAQHVAFFAVKCAEKKDEQEREKKDGELTNLLIEAIGRVGSGHRNMDEISDARIGCPGPLYPLPIQGTSFCSLLKAQ